MTVEIAAELRVTLLAFLPFLIGHCASDEGPGWSPAQTTSGATGTTDEGAPTTDTGAAPDTSVSASSSSTSAGDSSDPGESSTTGPAQPGCGDGIRDDGEQCDEGWASNRPGGTCLPECVLARCGDGHLQEGVEECDLGDAVNEFKYGGCVPVTCKWGPRCGDGEVDAPDEVCDPGDPNGQGDGLVSCEGTCRYKGRIVFLSSEKYSGNLGGLAGADALCRDLAAAFDAIGADTYRAWLSDAKHSPLDRFEHGDNFKNVPYVLRSGVAIAADFGDLIAHGPYPGITITDTYESVIGASVWTNTGIDGAAFSATNHCQEWGSAAQDSTARTGENWQSPQDPGFPDWQKYGRWTSKNGKSCDGARHLYCFEN